MLASNKNANKYAYRAKLIRPVNRLLMSKLMHIAVRLPSFVMGQDVFLRLAVQNVDIVIRQVDWLYPVTGGINHHRDASTCHAARNQHRYQACG